MLTDDDQAGVEMGHVILSRGGPRTIITLEDL